MSQVDFSDPEKAKEIAEQLAEENQRLRGNSKKGEVESKVQKVSDMGFSECPGFLSEYRDILLSDDGEPAMVLFSTDDNGNETGRAALTATEIADRLINALPTDEKGKVLFSGQHLDTGTTEKPPEEEVTLAEGEYDDSPEAVEKRVEAQAKAIGQPMPGSGKE